MRSLAEKYQDAKLDLKLLTLSYIQYGVDYEYLEHLFVNVSEQKDQLEKDIIALSKSIHDYSFMSIPYSEKIKFLSNSVNKITVDFIHKEASITSTVLRI